MIRALFAIALPVAMLMVSCGKQQLVTHSDGFESENVRNMRAGFNDTDLFYSLPRTVLSIDVEVRKNGKMPGPFARYANRFLGLDDVILSASKTYEIKGININTFAEPDPEQLYFVRLPEDISHAAYLSLSKSGLITGISRKKTTDIPLDAYQFTKDFGIHESKPGFNYFMDINLTERIDTIIHYVFEDTAVVQQQTFRRSLIEKTTEQRAREVAEHILEIREKKFDLISGFQEIPYTKDALEFMHAELSRLENEYLTLFTGITSHSTMIYRFIHRPSKEDAAKKHTLFYFSERDGVIARAESHTNLQHVKPVILAYQSANATKSLRQPQQQRLPDAAMPAKGIHYRLPEYSDIDILIGAEPRAKSRKLINQFGVVKALPAKNMEIDFHPGTGSIRSIGIEKTEEKEL